MKRRVEKIWAPADRVLCEIGRFVLLRPRISGLLLISAVILTFFSNNLWAPAVDSGLTPEVINLTAAAGQDEPQSPGIELPVPSSSEQPEPLATEAAASMNDEAATSAPIQVNDSPAPASDWQVTTVRKGDNLAKIFKRNNLRASDLHKIANLPGVKTAVHALKPGQELRFRTNDQGHLQQLVLADNADNHLISISANNGSFTLDASAPTVSATKKTTLTRADPEKLNPLSSQITNSLKQQSASQAPKSDSGLAYVSGEIQHSLSKAAHNAGLSVHLTEQLAAIFASRELTRNFKVGDEFRVLYENKPSEKNKHGNIMAAQLVHGGQHYQFIRFTSPDGHTDYYNPQGQSSQPALSRAPLNYKHISSVFTFRRLDPVLHIVHAHLGVDYAAPEGTPVKAAGDGVIKSATYHGGYGRVVVVQHDNKYSTWYAHLSRFADLKIGSKVSQGEVIGYVGQSGFATGPHLHYEIHVNNVPNNPLTVALPGKQIPAEYRSKFLALSRTLLAELQSNHKIQLAQNAVPDKKT